MTPLYLYDDRAARNFEPFALTRPLSEVRAGTEIIRARWERAAGTKSAGFIGAAHLQEFEETGAPPAVRGTSTLPAGSLIANTRFVVALDSSISATPRAFHSAGVVCAVRLDRDFAVDEFADGAVALGDVAPSGEAAEIRGRWLAAPWDLVGQLSDQLADDIPILGVDVEGVPETANVSGGERVYSEAGAKIEPLVFFDTSDGPIFVRRGATISAFTRIVGPTYIGEDTTIVGDAIRACSIGDHCKVRGEISGSVMLGHSNKGHTGFVGNSYLGRWVNLGAGTTTSNLKNTYGPVQMWTPSGLSDTGLQFLGTLLGDHAKTGIGTMLTTGCVIGAGANIFGAGVSPKHVPPFAWGENEPYGRYDADKFLQVAERVMARRHVTLSAATRRQLTQAFSVSERS